MKETTRFTAASLTTVALAALLTGCTGVTHSGSAGAPASPDCSQLLSTTVTHARSDTGDIDAALQALADNCSDEYEIAVDYVSHAGSTQLKVDHCDELLGYSVRAESIALLEEDGWCSSSTAVAADPEWPEGGLGWDEARDNAGSVQRVCGPLMSGRETADGTFLNVGRDYPSPDRFTFVFWDIYLEPIDQESIICGSGEIYLYDGVAQIEMRDPSALELWP